MVFRTMGGLMAFCRPSNSSKDGDGIVSKRVL